MNLGRLAIPLSCLLAAACAGSAPVPTGPPPDWKLASASMAVGNTFQAVGGGGGQISAQITGHDINGPTYQLAAGPTFVRGQGGGGAVIDVSIKGNRADGSVRNLPFSCILERNPDGSAHVTGAMGVGNTDFVISPREIVGRIGAITYTLGWNGSQYAGQTNPGGPAYIQLPATMATWSDIEVVTVMSILLIN